MAHLLQHGGVAANILNYMLLYGLCFLAVKLGTGFLLAINLNFTFSTHMLVFFTLKYTSKHELED